MSVVFSGQVFDADELSRPENQVCFWCVDRRQFQLRKAEAHCVNYRFLPEGNVGIAAATSAWGVQMVGLKRPSRMEDPELKLD
ncbi:hypothetical protein ACO22_00578 [Paracoccidioides brasiliensis]|uniref:Uncharacterized protein n=1 Tax=Paracoccidioides brasiliensis TaxID=121759 RepID=A0A1D2JP80_PARBR|nr:hypothetical protein ACO22_00578 [Paracoccidioides brasiliensis]ODH50771.1 hypothetical protein GX48_03088 [Paracoccidioides brasiliensis]